MKGLLKRVQSNDFARNVVTLMTGTAIAQAIPVAISPILTRLYSPDDFGILALFLAVTSILSVFATMRYEFAIVQPKYQKDAAAITILTLSICSVVSLLLLLLVFFFNEAIVDFFQNESISSWLYLTPISVWLFGSYQALMYWFGRKKRFNVVSKSKVNQSLSGAAGQVGFYYLFSKIGLIFGQLLNQLVGVMYLLKQLSPLDKARFKRTDREVILKNAKRYKKFPKFSVIGALADKGSVQMPIFVLGRVFDFSITGMFSLTFRVLNVPMSLLSTALSQVLFQKVSALAVDSPKSIQGFILKLFVILISMMVPFVFFIYFWGETVFAFVFGEEWRDAGKMAAVLVLAVAIRFAVSPLSTVLALEQNVKLGMLWQLIYLTTITVTLIYFSSFGIDTLLIAFAVHEVILYVLYLIFILKGAKALKAVV